MKRRALLLGGIAAVVIRPPNARAIVCTNCSQFAQQLLDYAQQAKSYATQLQQQITELQQLKNMVQNTLSMPMQIYGQIQGAMGEVQRVTQLGSLLSGKSGSIIQRLNSINGYSNYLSSLGTNLTNLPQMFTNWQQQLGNNWESLGRQIGVQQNSLRAQAAMQDQIQAQAADSSGVHQAVQASVMMAANNGAILQQMEQTLLAQAQSVAQYQETLADRQALKDEAALKMFNAPEIAADGHKGF